MAWDAAASGLRCGSCGHVEPVGVPSSELAEHDLSDALRSPKAHWNLGGLAREVKCNECGASVEFPDGIAATRCAFCDSPSVLAREARSDLIAPESLIPFGVSRDQAAAAFRSWLGGLWLRPSDLRSKASISELRGVYVPYWTFDASVMSRWSADAGYYYYESETYTVVQNGKGVTRTRSVRKVRWEPASGTRHDQYDDHLACASVGLPGDMARFMANFDTRRLVPYTPQVLQGFTAETYAVDLRDAWSRAREELASSQLARCAGDVPGDTQRNLRATHQFLGMTYKHVLLPVWVAAFRYRGEVYRFLVNGQTGLVAGKAPWSPIKIVLATVLALALCLILAHFATR